MFHFRVVVNTSLLLLFTPPPTPATPHTLLLHVCGGTSAEVCSHGMETVRQYVSSPPVTPVDEKFTCEHEKGRSSKGRSSEKNESEETGTIESENEASEPVISLNSL